MEVCVDSIESALNAANAGASRLELCSALSEGGLTPSPGLLKMVKTAVMIPVFVMLRPRRGGDFVYSLLEIEAVKYDAWLLKECGADGFVFGALTINGEVDVHVCREILEVVAPLPCTFHRAFDVCVSPLDQIEILINLGFHRVLTSGREITAEKGVLFIRELVQRAGDRIIIVPGSGITTNNLAQILQTTQAKEFHASARTPKEFPVKWVTSSKCSMGSADGVQLMITNEAMVREMIIIASRFIQ